MKVSIVSVSAVAGCWHFGQIILLTLSFGLDLLLVSLTNFIGKDSFSTATTPHDLQ